MTNISPLLSSRLNNSNNITITSNNKKDSPSNRHEKIYQDLQKRAHEAKPNEAKAKMVKQGIMGNPITATVDTVKDAGNFVKAVKDGEMGDNSLGRINDLGLKLGALLTASFLALHSKTKTEKIMKFVGGGTFIAAMSLWPKLFINLPARLVHGFRIDNKYISAQGDKKDFFLDNQFLVWDAYPEEQLRKDAENAGIDYDSENGKEKIQRKMQKTALQNRTLWMATAGFATPLITALSGNYIEPLVKKAVVNQETKKAIKTIKNFEENVTNANSITVDTKAINELLNNEKLDRYADYLKKLEPNTGNEESEDFFKQLEGLLSPSKITSSLPDEDNFKPILQQNTHRLAETLKEIYENTTEVKVDSLIASIEEELKKELNKKETSSSTSDSLEELNKKASSSTSDPLEELAELFTDSDGNKVKNSKVHVNSEEIIKKLDEQLEDLKKLKESKPSNSGNGAAAKCTITEAKKILHDELSKYITKENIDDSKFGTAIKSYANQVFSKIPSRERAILDALNPLVGAKAESIYTLEYEKTMDRFFKNFGIKGADLEKLKTANTDEAIDTLSNAVQQALERNKNNYKAFLEKLTPNRKGVEEYIKSLEYYFKDNLKDKDKSAFDLITSGKVEGLSNDYLKKLNKAVLGGDTNTNGVVDLIKLFIREQKVNIETLSLKPRICAEFENALMLVDKEGKKVVNLEEDDLILARKMIYDGKISTIITKGDALPANWDEVAKTIFDENLYSPDIRNEILALKDLFINKGKLPGYTSVENYVKAPSVTQLIKDHATRLSNNKAWLKIFGPMAAALVAVTLLVQPFFGNIKNEFPDEKKENGGAK